MSNNYSVQEAWELLFKELDIKQNLIRKDIYKISAKKIKEYKEPRLMSKWDSSESRPRILSDNHISMLPISRKEYVMGNFDLYMKFPETENQITEKIKVPYFESINTDAITSEAKAINVMNLSGILEDFLDVRGNFSTFSGKMGVGDLDFFINTSDKKTLKIKVNKAQCEIDAGYENDDSVVIVEAKNVVNNDFHVRQLYYPYRLWEGKVNKPIRLVFVVYTNKIFRLYEYRFKDKFNISSIELVKSKFYSIDDTTINLDEIKEIQSKTKIITDDDRNKFNKRNAIPFIQADSFEKVISLIENLYENPMNKFEVAEDILQMNDRQSDYYFNAARYLGFLEKKDGLMCLTKIGSTLINMSYRQRVTLILQQMFKHQILNELFEEAYYTESLPSLKTIQDKMKYYNVCSDKVLKRRSASVRNWLKWIFELTNISSK